MSEREWGREGKETMGFATPNGLLPLRALAGTAKKQKLEAEASESQKARTRSVYAFIFSYGIMMPININLKAEASECNIHTLGVCTSSH